MKMLFFHRKLPNFAINVKMYSFPTPDIFQFLTFLKKKNSQICNFLQLSANSSNQTEWNSIRTITSHRQKKINAETIKNYSASQFPTPIISTISKTAWKALFLKVKFWKMQETFMPVSWTSLIVHFSDIEFCEDSIFFILNFVKICEDYIFLILNFVKIKFFWY